MGSKFKMKIYILINIFIYLLSVSRNFLALNGHNITVVNK